MDGCGLIVIALAVCGVVVMLALASFDRSWSTRQQRINTEMQARVSAYRKDADTDVVATLTSVWRQYREYFPYLPKPSVTERTSEALTAGIKELIHTLPTYGEIPSLSGMPAPALPEQERLRHLYVVGKSGSGKSTFLEHLILGDITAGAGVCVLSPEGEFFRQRLLPLLPESRADDLIYYAPADSDNTVCFNPLALESGDDANRAAEELFTIMHRIFSDGDLGSRMQTLLHNALGALTGRDGATLWDVKRLLQDESYRLQVVADAEPYVRDFWLSMK